jgi:ATP-dependent DNA helicase DinG
VFDPMAAAVLQHHVVVDLETTGLDPSRDEVVEVGALFVENGEVVHRLSKLFSPSRPLPLAVQRLTGLDDEQLKGHPPFADFIEELKGHLDGWTVVAHNAAFEQSFLADVLAEVQAPVLDSCELLHYLYPELESHSLDSAVRWAGVGTGAVHRALKDCEDTYAVIQVALERCVAAGRTDDVADLLGVLTPGRSSAGDGPGAPEPAELSAMEGDPLLEVLHRLHGLCKAAPVPLVLERSSRFLPAKAERVRVGPARERDEEDDDDGEEPVIDPVHKQELDAVLGPGGGLERKVPGFRSRPEQREMADAVAKVLNEGGVLAVEAGTGTGKSLAYLTPAALFAARNRRKVGIAPNTKALQDQLVEKDLPKLHAATGGSFGYAVLKGQNNYLCRRRALEVTQVEASMGLEERAPRAYLRALLRRSPEGDLDRLSWWFRERYPRLTPLMVSARSEAATTLGDRCPHYSKCFYHSAVAQAKAADVLVINQSLALAWPARYPKLDHLVMDEAHELEDVATTAFASELSDFALSQLLDRLVGRGRARTEARRGFAAELRRGLAAAGAGRAGRDLVAEIEELAHRLNAELDDLGDAVSGLCRSAKGESDYGGELRITEEVRAARGWTEVRNCLLSLRDQLDGMAKLIGTRVPELIPNLAIKNPSLDREAAGAQTQLMELSGLAGELTDPPKEGRCYQATVRGRGWQLSAQPVEVAGLFTAFFAESKRSLVLTSATLSVAGGRGGSSWVLDRLGLNALEDEKKPVFLRSGTPFKLEQQALVVLVTDAPDPFEAEFVEWAATRISGLAQFMGGRVLGLFASTRRLDEVGEAVRATLEPQGIEVMRQSRGAARALAARQERDHGSVLLGTKSFWQGVDIPGRGVGCVFIDKLPIEPGGRPIVAAREERFGTGTGNLGFMRYRLPRALLQLRQGVGRLIRSHDDHGVVVLADPGSPGYRRLLLEALEGYRVEVLPWSRARWVIRDSLVAMGLKASSPPPRGRPAA